MHGDQGWYDFVPEQYRHNALEIYYLSMKPDDRPRVGPEPWLEFLEGHQPDFPDSALRNDLARVRERILGMRSDTTTPDTRLADDPMKFNPASVHSLVRLMMGGLMPDRRAPALFCRLRYFDPIERRAGIPRDVAALSIKLNMAE